MKTNSHSSSMTKGREVAFEYVSKHPDMPHRTLARLLYVDHPKLFHSIDQARSMVRSIKGRAGQHNRDHMADKTFVLPEPTADNKFSLPEPLDQGWCPYVLPDGLESIGLFGDVHVPFHDKRAVETMLGYFQKVGIDSIIINGDAFDCYALSRFQKDPDLIDFPREREKMRQFLMALRNLFPEIPIYYKEGNHEKRFGDLLINKAPAFYGMSEFSMPVILDLFNLGIEWIDLKRPLHYRELNILHGHELPARTGGVNPARTTLLKTRECTLVNHYHRKTGDMQKTIRDNQIQAWSVGCLCDLHPQFMPINDWQHGFAHIEGGKSWKVNNFAILGDEVV